MTSFTAGSTRPVGHRWLALALLALTQFVLVLDASIVSVALPSIEKDLNFAPEDLSWVVNAYALLFGGFLLLGGRLADLLGRRRMFIAGISGFAAASLVGALAQNSAWLVTARGMQGLAAAIVAPAALSLVLTTFTEAKERNTALGIWGAVAGSGGAAGVVLGGVLTDKLGWESVLYVNVPIGLAVAAVAPILLTEGRDRSTHRHFDFAGATAVTAGLGALVYAVVDANDAGWASAQTIGLLVLSAALLAAFVGIEARSAQPLVPLRIFKLRSLTAGNITSLLMGMSLFPAFYFLALYYQQVLGYGPLKAGFAELPVALAIIVAASAAPQVVARYGVRPTVTAGLALSAVGLAWFSQAPADGTFLANMFAPSIIVGGAGLAFVGFTIAATAEAAPDQAGLASGLVNMTTQIGGALGVAVLVAVATGRTDDAIANGTTVPQVALNEGFQAAFLGGAVIAVLASVVAYVLTPGRLGRQQAADVGVAGTPREPEPVAVGAPAE